MEITAEQTRAMDPTGLRDYVVRLAEMAGRHIRDHGWVYPSIPAAIAALADEPVVAPLSLPDMVEPGLVKACFDNAFNLAVTHPDYLYVEGYAQCTVVPVAHAWCVHAETGQVVDPTWVNLSHATEANYYGIRFSRRFILAQAAETGDPSVLEDDWRHDHQVLKRGFVVEDGVAVGWNDPPPF